MPRVQDHLDSMAVVGMFSTMDILSAYSKVPVAEKGISKTVFTMKHGLFEFAAIPFGLLMAPDTYQWLKEFALSGMQWSLFLIYHDDAIVFSTEVDEQVDCLDKILNHVGAPGLKLKPSKCVFFSIKVSFLEHNLTKEGILPNPDNVAMIFIGLFLG